MTTSVLPQVLGKEKFEQLPGSLKKVRLHKTTTKGAGFCRIKTASKLFDTFLPKSNTISSFESSISHEGDTEIWQTRIDQHQYKSVMRTTEKEGSKKGKLLLEKVGPFQFAYQVSAKDDTITYQSCRAKFLGINLPSSIAPSTSWKETATEKGWLLEGKVEVPYLGTLLEIEGEFVDREEINNLENYIPYAINK